jgi:two-component system, NarL family, sensor histidine kinase DevS
VTFDGPLDTLVTDRIAEQMLAVMREGLSNVARHAHATAVDVVVNAHAAGVSLTITDNGRGMQGVTRRSGLQNLLHRAAELGGELVVGSPSGGGTRLEWSAPLPTPSQI